jgi:Ca2+-binding EF-hand superfamily protein
VDPNALEITSDDALRVKFLRLAKKCPECLTRLPKKVDFEKFLESVNRQFVRLTQQDAKKIFALFDPQDTGFIDGTMLLKMAVTGSGRDPFTTTEMLGTGTDWGLGGEEDTYTYGQTLGSVNIVSNRPRTSSTAFSTSTNLFSNNNNNNNSINNNISHNISSDSISLGLSRAHSLNDLVSADTRTNTVSHENLSFPAIKEAITKICGLNTHLLEFSFATIDKNTTKAKYVSYETFVKLLTDGGLTRDMKDVRGLFMALGGKSGSANVQELFKVLPSVVSDRLEAKAIALTEAQHAHSVMLAKAPEYPRRQRTSKIGESSLSLLDRAVREAMRKSFREIRAAFESADQNKTGFLPFSTFHRIVRTTCCPMGESDFRIITDQLNTESSEDDSNISWKHFIRIYSTKVPPHALEATGNSEFAIKLRRKYFMTSPKLFTTVNRPSHPTQRPVTAMGSRSAINDMFRNSQTAVPATASPPRERDRTDCSIVSDDFYPTDVSEGFGINTMTLEQRPKSAGPSIGGRAALTMGMNTNINMNMSNTNNNRHGYSDNHNNNNNNSHANEETGIDYTDNCEYHYSMGPESGSRVRNQEREVHITSITALKRRVAANRARVTSSLNSIRTKNRNKIQIQGLGEGKRVMNDTMGSNMSFSDTLSENPSAEKQTRRAWSDVLKYCHRVDSQTSGLIPRDSFLDALKESLLADLMDENEMERTASRYEIPGPNGGLLVDYLHCFRVHYNKTVKKPSSKGFLQTIPSLPLDSSLCNEHGGNLNRPPNPHSYDPNGTRYALYCTALHFTALYCTL